MDEWIAKMIGKSRSYEIGDKVAFWMIDHKGQRTHGTVIQRLDIEDDISSPFYLIRVDTPPVGCHYEVRSGWPLEMIPAERDQVPMHRLDDEDQTPA